jgi:hypothetical protein
VLDTLAHSGEANATLANPAADAIPAEGPESSEAAKLEEVNNKL